MKEALSSTGENVSKHLRVKYLRDEDSFWYFNYTLSVQHCQDLDAQLWDVLDGKAEWEAVVNHSKHSNHAEKLDYGVWIDGKVAVGCDGQFTQRTLTIWGTITALMVSSLTR